MKKKKATPSRFVLQDGRGHVTTHKAGAIAMKMETAPSPGTHPSGEVQRALLRFANAVDKELEIDKDMLRYIAWGVRRYALGKQKGAWPTVKDKKVDPLRVLTTYAIQTLKGTEKSDAIKLTAGIHEVDVRTVRDILKNAVVSSPDDLA